jgi:hypothetical protein
MLESGNYTVEDVRRVRMELREELDRLMERRRGIEQGIGLVAAMLRRLRHEAEVTRVEV